MRPPTPCATASSAPSPGRGSPTSSTSPTQIVPGIVRTAHPAVRDAARRGTSGRHGPHRRVRLADRARRADRAGARTRGRRRDPQRARRRRPIHRSAHGRVLLRHRQGHRDREARRRAWLRPGRAARPTATRSATCRCWSASARRSPSTPTASCASSLSNAAGGSSRSVGSAAERCARASPLAVVAESGATNARHPGAARGAGCRKRRRGQISGCRGTSRWTGRARAPRRSRPARRRWRRRPAGRRGGRAGRRPTRSPCGTSTSRGH